MSLARLTYVSDSNKLIEWPLVKEILEVAQPKNQRLGVSGILLSHGMNFLQRLEGEQQIIEDLYQSILNDSRHTNLRLLEVTPISHRQFGQWSMQGFEFEQLSTDHQTHILDRYFNDKRAFYIPTDDQTCLNLIDDLKLS